MGIEKNWNAISKLEEKTEIDEGFLEYEQEENQQKILRMQYLDKIISSFSDKSGHVKTTTLKEVLSEVSDDEKLDILNRLLKTKTASCLQNLRYFGELPNKYQQIIVKFIQKNNFGKSDLIIKNLFQVFEKIVDKELSDFIIFLKPTCFYTIAQNKEKLPHVTDEEMLELLRNNKGQTSEWYDWVSLVASLDKFPDIDKNEVIEGVFKQSTNKRLSVLVTNREKLGLSEREIIDLFYKKDSAPYLLSFECVHHISEEYYQEIAERCIEDGNAWAILSNLQNLNNVDAKSLIDKILLITVPEKGSSKTGKELLSEYISSLPENWLIYVPQHILELFFDHNPKKMADIVEKLDGRISKEQIVEKLIKEKKFGSLLLQREKLDFNVKNYPDFIEKHIEEIYLKNMYMLMDFITIDNLSLVLSHLFSNLHYSLDNYDESEKPEVIFLFISELFSKFNLPFNHIRKYLSNEQKENIIRIKEKIPNFETKIFSSFEILFSFLSLGSLDVDLLINNDNLIKSFEENPSMATKLLIQYPKFSESPKENIDTVLEIKRKIMEYHPDINPNSQEFRILVQEQLKSYRRNLDIITQMKEEGINMDNWLNYSEETLFELGGEEASYAELIKLPSKRIQKTLQKYEEEIRTSLLKYKKELFDKQVSLVDIPELEEKIKKMEQLAQEAKDIGNEGKAQGIQKGIEGLKKQMENPKKIPAWLKIMSDIDTVSKLFAKVSEINTQIATLNTELTNLSQNTAAESQKKMFENKKKIKELSAEFVSSLGTTSSRMDSLLISIQDSLSQTLGKEVSEELVSKLNTDLSEDQEHFNSDKATLQNILKMNESDDDVKGSLLKIKVWDRNPDIDLYQGNYSDCCVRIDSAYHGSNSPISDYITDLGIQIVAVYDEKTGKPFATAWCFVGEDEQGNKAFVVDNIEAMGPCMKYSHDITEKLKAYIEKYAKSSGLEIISQGPDHNDLIITTNIEEKYKKLGRYNTNEEYYLEAEPDDNDDNDDDEYENEIENIETEEINLEEEQRLIDEYTRTQENIVSMEESLNRAQNW